MSYSYSGGDRQACGTSIDVDRAPVEIHEQERVMTVLSSHLTFLYGSERTPALLDQVDQILRSYKGPKELPAGDLTERDAMLITYSDQVRHADEPPLHTLDVFCSHHLRDLISAVHILPFYPWTSDDGFSVVDYLQVAPEFGTWADIHEMGIGFRLMFDAVINHVSAENEWFKAFLEDISPYRDYFITVAGTPDLSRVVRPRALPLLSSFLTPSGEKQVWTTFSSDQVDLNYQNPQVLLEILRTLLSYVEHGAGFLRMDAIAYLWKEIGTTCINLPQAHGVIQFLRAAISEVAPHVHLITETNIPHVDNISYFGDGYNEAQLVYNFALPPLTLHTFHTADARILSGWASTLTLPSEKTTFFNFLASHDGVGLNPARGILTPLQIDALVQKAIEHGGLISYKDNPDGTQSPYEMNINYFDALSDPQGGEPLQVQVDRFIAAQAIMLSLVGMPGIYFHSLFGSRGWPEGVKLTGRVRTINREKCDFEDLQRELSDATSLRSLVFERYSHLLHVRRGTAAFHPHGVQHILDVHSCVFALLRESPDRSARVLCLHNVSEQTPAFTAPCGSAVDMISENIVHGSELSMQPYQVMWIRL
jgi:sucrose phosphorylase